MNNIAKRLHQVREHRNISQARIARTIGVSVSTVQGYEHGRTHITTDRLEDLARALQCEPADLLAPPEASPPRYKTTRTPLVRTTAIDPMCVGFYGRSAHTTVAVEADALTKAACGLPADGPNELVWQHWYNRIHTDDHARVNAELVRLNNPRDGVFNMQYRLLGVDGIERCIIDYGRMVFDDVGGPVRLRGLMLDITDEPRSNKTDDKIRRILATLRPGLIALLILTAGGLATDLGRTPELVFNFEQFADDPKRIDANNLT